MLIFWTLLSITGAHLHQWQVVTTKSHKYSTNSLICVHISRETTQLTLCFFRISRSSFLRTRCAAPSSACLLLARCWAKLRVCSRHCRDLMFFCVSWEGTDLMFFSVSWADSDSVSLGSVLQAVRDSNQLIYMYVCICICACVYACVCVWSGLDVQHLPPTHYCQAVPSSAVND